MVENKDKESQGFLPRWSERKLQSMNKEDVSHLASTDLQTDQTTQAELLEQKHAEHEENRKIAEAIDIEGLTHESDYTVFFKDGVPESLKQLALRKLWRTNPIFANLDGLNDYDENFAATNMVLETFESAWKVGKGYLNRENPPEKSNENTDITTLEHKKISEETSDTEEDRQLPLKKVDNEGSPSAIDIETVTSNITFDEKNMEDPNSVQQKSSHLSLRNRLGIES